MLLVISVADEDITCGKGRASLCCVRHYVQVTTPCPWLFSVCIDITSRHSCHCYSCYTGPEINENMFLYEYSVLHDYNICLMKRYLTMTFVVSSCDVVMKSGSIFVGIFDHDMCYRPLMSS